MTGEYTFVDQDSPSVATWNGSIRDQLLVICTSSTRPASPVTGRRIYETDTLREYVYTGSAWLQTAAFGAWTSYTPTWASTGTQPTIGNGSFTGYYIKRGRELRIYAGVIMGSTTTYGTGTWYLSGLPGGFTTSHNASGSATILDSSVDYMNGSCWCPANNNIYLMTTNAAPKLATPTVPMTWAVNDYFFVDISIMTVS